MIFSIIHKVTDKEKKREKLSGKRDSQAIVGDAKYAHFVFAHLLPDIKIRVYV